MSGPDGAPDTGEPKRVMVLLDQVVVAEIVALTLNHGMYVTRDAKNPFEAMALVENWNRSWPCLTWTWWADGR